MKRISPERSEVVFPTRGSWSPFLKSTGTCVLGRTAKRADREGNKEGTSPVELESFLSFESFAFKTLPLSGGQEGLWISAHLDSDSPLFQPTWEVYVSSFHDFERRDLEEQRKVMAHPRYRFSAVMCDARPVGLLSWWVLDGFVFVEHFAIAASARSGGLGARVLTLLQAHVKVPILVDVEPLGSDPHAERRVAFYQRQGFHYCEEAVTLPPYLGKGTAPSNLMAWGCTLDAALRARCVAEIETVIYGIVRADPVRALRHGAQASMFAAWQPYDAASTLQVRGAKRLSVPFRLRTARSCWPVCRGLLSAFDPLAFYTRRARGESHSDA